ncbi:helix-turn-helix transcriptional regulator [Gryllotalpicola daejeonensis]
MLSTSARLLSLLALLQARAEWSGTELAARLEVTTRTVRNDVERLRRLGYPVAAARGSQGGYRLKAGAQLPPLLLDDEEAVAIAVALRSATGIAGFGDSGAQALAKLEQVLPAALRAKVAALQASVDHGPDSTHTDAPDPEVDHEVLAQLAEAIRAVEWVRFDYRAGEAPEEPLLVEPYRLVAWQRRWYLVARSPQTRRWGVYRVDLMSLRMPTRRRFEPQPLPAEDFTAFVLREVAAAGWLVHARIVVHAASDQVLARIHPAVGIVEALSDERSVLVTGADTLETIAAYVGMLGFDFEIESPRELVTHVEALGRRYLAAAASSPR